MDDPQQYDGFATYEELNLSPQEIQELKEAKKRISEKARKKLREWMDRSKSVPKEVLEAEKGAIIELSKETDDD